jgi:RNA polymerase sigma-70 factor, ECF subfamily
MLGVSNISHLVKRAKKGNEKAFLKLINEYEGDIYRTAFLYVKNREDALDIVQETAYRSFRSIKDLKEPKFFKTWLIKIAINCSLDFLKKQRKIVNLHKDYEEFILDDKYEDIPNSIFLQDLLEKLEEQQKSIIILKFYYGYTFEEVSEILNTPVGTTKTILYRTIKKLRENYLEGDKRK